MSYLLPFRDAEAIDPVEVAMQDYIVSRSFKSVSQREAECMANEVLETVGRERLDEVGVTDGADPLMLLTDDEVRTSMPKAMECLDDAATTDMIAATLKPAVLGNLQVERPACLAEGWMDSLGRERLVDLFALWAAGAGSQIGELLTPEELTTVMDVVAGCKA